MPATRCPQSRDCLTRERDLALGKNAPIAYCHTESGSTSFSYKIGPKQDVRIGPLVEANLHIALVSLQISREP